VVVLSSLEALAHVLQAGARSIGGEVAGPGLAQPARRRDHAQARAVVRLRECVREWLSQTEAMARERRSMEYSTIEVEADGARGRITLNRPDQLNPLSTATLDELIEAARWFDTKRAVKVVVVAGHGRAFSAGADLAAFASARSTGAPDIGAPTVRHAADAGRRAADAIEAMQAVTIARLHGYCVGGGLILAAACDLRVAADDTVFSIPEVDLGIPLAWGGIPRLVREIGPALTKELVMTCRPFTSAEVLAAGFLNRVVSPSRLDTEIDDLIAALEQKSALTLAATKRHVNAVTAGMVGIERSWNDADSLVTALQDAESRAVTAAYLQRKVGARSEPTSPSSARRPPREGR
jgi:enoyl-CoA hydratase/carnithine racemase